MALNSVSQHDAPASPHPSASGTGVPGRADLMDLVRASLEDMKAEDVVEIDLAGKTSIADAMVVATGRSDRHVGAIADRLIKELKDNGFGAPRVEGMPACDWVLIDGGDVIAHIFRPEVRSFYNLEKMWGEDRPAESAKA
ncbi:MAG: ribosome silencing factor [Salinarimonadaceae bacterium]|nr:MAG: ribosome silencing factor [Salinarimonadaceae bacterium]